MRTDTFVLYGKDTREMVDVSYGGLYREQWTLEQHPGGRILSRPLLGLGGISPVRYLYPRHLELLYERFARANPSGTELGLDGVIEARYSQGLDSETRDRLYEERKMFVAINNTDEHLGYPHLRPYLPELFEPETVRQMEADPWLDCHLLDKALKAGHVPDRRDYHPRWSPEWRAYCDRVIPRQA